MRDKLQKAFYKLKENDIDPNLLKVNINMSLSSSDWLRVNEPDDYINKYYIDIELYDNYESEDKTKIGESVCYYISEYDYANNTWIDVYDTADAFSGDLELAVSPIVNSDGGLKEEYFDNGVLYIDRFYIKPEFRNKGVGTIVLALLVDVLGRGAGVITVTPVPFEKDGREKIKEEDPNYKVEKMKLICLLEKFGFSQDKTYQEVWVKDTSLED